MSLLINNNIKCKETELSNKKTYSDWMEEKTRPNDLRL